MVFFPHVDKCLLGRGSKAGDGRRGSTKGTTFGRCLGQQTITTTGLPTRTSPRSCYPVAGLFEPRQMGRPDYCARYDPENDCVKPSAAGRAHGARGSSRPVGVACDLGPTPPASSIGGLCVWCANLAPGGPRRSAAGSAARRVLLRARLGRPGGPGSCSPRERYSGENHLNRARFRPQNPEPSACFGAGVNGPWPQSCRQA
jgi:hypothetical protein